jgi:hypothetical protein
MFGISVNKNCVEVVALKIKMIRIFTKNMCEVHGNLEAEIQGHKQQIILPLLQNTTVATVVSFYSNGHLVAHCYSGISVKSPHRKAFK